MRLVIYEDERGYKHRSLLRDRDPDTMAPKGIIQDPPDLSLLDWEGMRRDIHNALVEQGLVTWADVQRAQNAVSGIVKGVIANRIVALYRQKDK